MGANGNYPHRGILMNNINSKTVLFITGAFVSNSCWDEWRSYFESKGFAVLAPPWPHKDAPAEVLRSRQPDPDIASIRLPEVIEHYADIAARLNEKPILIGHSTGGLIAQLLLHRGIAAAAVAIHPFPPQGVIPFEFSFWKAGWKALGLFSSSKESYLMSFEDWQYAFTNGMPLEQQKAGYDKLVIPESKLIAKDAVTKTTRIDFSKPHEPLLITSGSIDNIIPAHVNYRVFSKYKDPGSVTDYKEFKGRNHYVLGQPTWKEDADYIIKWIDSLSRPAQPSEKQTVSTA